MKEREARENEGGDVQRDLLIDHELLGVRGHERDLLVLVVGHGARDLRCFLRWRERRGKKRVRPRRCADAVRELARGLVRREARASRSEEAKTQTEKTRRHSCPSRVLAVY
jgi:hypothetical protein